MTWIDWTFLVALLIFVAAGAKLGSVWTSACIAGGFAGCFLADTYAPSVGSLMGGFWGASVLAAALLYLAGVLALLIPGLIFRKAMDSLFLGFVDGFFGVATGLAAGFVATALVLIAVVPVFPPIESAAAWKGSTVVKPLQHRFEGWFSTIRIPLPKMTFPSPAPLAKGLGVAAGRMEDSLRDAPQRVASAIKKERSHFE